ncbi:DUF7000 family protein [Flagellimonas pacifica]|uniref:DUF7000 domain-containing protein n=1 Tax=Flagellimonas pacifica TaxID=1247520 RepID=A0A285MUS3_9FLAO|nr:hypothetical protein [Allomuricauda parva]SNZ00925.1 hypothetical protein SAMN06265377_2753 [Allomuricauda parva]
MKESLNQHFPQYKEQVTLGHVPKAYKALMAYLMGLRNHFINQYSGEFIVGSFYQGYMDMSYFPITPKSLKSQKLKIGLMFNHEKLRFEIWLVGQNKQVQKNHWELFQSNNWNRYPLSSTPKESIIEHILVENPNFNDLDTLNQTLEKGTLKFIHDVSEVFTE